MGFDTLGLAEPIQQAVAESGYTEPTPIQAQAIPIILDGKDVIGASQTGTGKTAAFALPSLSKIEKLGKPQILVLEPTRELAHQVAEQFEKYGKHLGIKVALLYGGVGHGAQDEALKAGGFDYPDDNNPSYVDSEKITLAQRKNQLSRRLRIARRSDSVTSKYPAPSPSDNQNKLESFLSYSIFRLLLYLFGALPKSIL